MHNKVMIAVILSALSLAACYTSQGQEFAAHGGQSNVVGGEERTQGNSVRVDALDKVELTRGGRQTLKVSIQREGGYQGEIKFSLQPPREAKGITFAPADWQIGVDETEKSVTAQADGAASVGTFTWTLVVRPRDGKPITENVTVTVRAR